MRSEEPEANDTNFGLPVILYSGLACPGGVAILNRPAPGMPNPDAGAIQGTDDFTLASDGAETDILISTARFAYLGGDRKT